MSSKYVILVEANLDQKKSQELIKATLTTIGKSTEFILQTVKISDSGITNLKKQIESSLKNINIGVNATVTGAGGGAGTTNVPSLSGDLGGTATGPAGGVNLAQRVNEIRSTALGGTVDVKAIETIDGITSATLKYKNALDSTITEVYRMNEETKNLEMTQRTYADSEAQASKAIQSDIAKQTQGITTLDASYQKLSQTKNAISAATSAKNLETGAGIDPQKINDASNAAQRYEDVLNGIKAKGGIISNQDKQNIASAQIGMRDLTNIIKQETAEIEKANKAYAAQNKAIDDQVAKAQKTLDATNSLTINKSSNNKQVKDAVAANRELADSIAAVSDQRKRGIPVSQESINQLEKSRIASQNAGNALRTAGKDANNWTHEIDIAIKRTIEWAGAMTLFYGSIRQIKEGIQFIRDLNKELTNIQIVTGATQDQVAKMSQGFNNLAKELGSTTMEVAKGSLEWARQGKNAEETAMLLKNSTMMAKLANMDAAQSTEYMTSIMNGFQLQATDMMGVLDQLTALDNAYATSVAEIADAMQRSSNSAKQSGVSLTELASYITILSSTTRKSAESIGESFSR